VSEYNEASFFSSFRLKKTLFSMFYSMLGKEKSGLIFFSKKKIALLGVADFFGLLEIVSQA